MANNEILVIDEQSVHTVWNDFSATESRDFRESVQADMQKYDPGFQSIDLELFSHTMLVEQQPVAAEAERVGLLLGYRTLLEVTGDSLLADNANAYLESQAAKFDYGLLRSPAFRSKFQAMVTVDYAASPGIETLLHEHVQDPAIVAGLEFGLAIAGRLVNPNREPLDLPLKVIPEMPISRQELRRQQVAHNKRYGLGAKRK